MRTVGRSSRWAVLVTALALLVAACSNNGGSGSDTGGPTQDADDAGQEAGIFPADLVNSPVHDGTPAQGGNITFGLESDIAAVSPNQNVIQPADVQMTSAVFDALITYGDDGMPVVDNTDHHANQLAEQITGSDDLATWTLTLRDGIEFSNGEPLTAQQVVDHTEWVKDIGACSCDSNAQNIGSITAEDDLTVIYELDDPIVDWPGKLTSGLGWITESGARQDAEHPDNPDIDHLVGTGAFAYESKSGDTYTVVANENYYGVDPDNDDAPLPYLDKIVFRPLADSVTRLQAVQSGGVDIMQTADTSNLVGAKEDPDLEVQPTTGSSTTILVLNLTHPPFGVEPEEGEDPRDTARRSLDDPDARNARMAFQISMDRNEMNQKYYKGTRVPAYGFLPPTNPFFDPEGQLDRPDPARAAELVDDLHAKGISTDVRSLCIDTPEAAGVGELLHVQNEAVGFTATMRTVEQAELVDILLNGAELDSWDRVCARSAQSADPDGLRGMLYTGETTNFALYSRDQTDEWLDEARRETDPDARKELYDQVQRQLAEDVVYIPLLFDYFGNVFRDDISGLTTPSPVSLGVIRPGNLYRKAG